MIGIANTKTAIINVMCIVLLELRIKHMKWSQLKNRKSERTKNTVGSNVYAPEKTRTQKQHTHERNLRKTRTKKHRQSRTHAHSVHRQYELFVSSNGLGTSCESTFELFFYCNYVNNLWLFIHPIWIKLQLSIRAVTKTSPHSRSCIFIVSDRYQPSVSLTVFHQLLALCSFRQTENLSLIKMSTSSHGKFHPFRVYPQMRATTPIIHNWNYKSHISNSRKKKWTQLFRLFI